jgi:hypothetical protein
MTTSPAPVTDRPPSAREPLLTPAFVRLTLADLAYFTAAGVAIFALPVFVTGPLGSDEAGAGLAFGAFAVTALVLRPYAGRLTDTVGRRPLLLGGALLCALVMGLTAFAETLAAVVLLRLLLGVAEAAFFVASFAALADLAPASRLGEALSYNSLGLYLGLALGPPLGEVLVGAVGFTGRGRARQLSRCWPRSPSTASGRPARQDTAPDERRRPSSIVRRFPPRSGSSPPWSRWGDSSPSRHCTPKPSGCGARASRCSSTAPSS